ncbi:MAG TPA: polysaccharide deacetylase family protein [Anaerolineae bacterium]|nr:polysaccharide deacetylase family protein [Anaerolineae bacterium]HOQ97973.1 polysaccharide deacetylase family protein [Anaerolineae bacterium]
MINVAGGLVLLAAAVGCLLAAWRGLRGPARRPLAVAGRVAAVTLVVTPLLAYGVWRLSKSRSFQFFGSLVQRVETAEPLVALTFDDGPTPGHTEEVLALLRAQGVRATFFLIGKEVEANPTQARLIVADGHQVGNHTYSHATMVAQSLPFTRQEVERTDELIRAAGYQGQILLCMPGCKRLFLLPLYLQQTNRTTVIWDVEPESYPEVDASTERIAAHVLERARPGSIILLHVMYSSRARTMAALPAIIEGLRAKGYRFVTVSELLAAGR